MSTYVPGTKFDTSDKQAVFDYVWKFITKQGKRSMSADNETCLYNGPDGVCCAAGCLLAPEARAELTEGQTVPGLASLYFVPGADRSFLESMQRAHDLCDCLDDTFVESFQQRMRDVARLHKLQVPS